MISEDSFAALVRRLREGDPEAIEEFCRTYEPELRRVIHVQLTDPYLRRLVDSLDVCQSVLANFFVRLRLGKLEFEHPNQVFKLLFTMARNRLLNLARDHRAEHRVQNGGEEDVMGQVSDRSPGPAQTVAWRELLELVRAKLDPEDRYLAEQRMLGHSWLELAEELQEKPDALRKRLSRAVAGLSERFGLATTLEE